MKVQLLKDNVVVDETTVFDSVMDDKWELVVRYYYTKVQSMMTSLQTSSLVAEILTWLKSS